MLNSLNRARRVWLWFAVLVCVGLRVDLDRAMDLSAKAPLNLIGDDLAIAQFINGVFVVVGLDGHVREFDLRPKTFFRTSRFSMDGTKLVGLRQQEIVVLNQNLAVEWEQAIHSSDVRSLALAPDGNKVVFTSVDRREQTVKLCVIASSGLEEVLETFPYGGDLDEPSWVLSWDPQSQRVAFGAKGEVRIIDLQTRMSDRLTDGFDPTWSPNGNLIAYRSAGRRLTLLNLSSGQSTTLKANVSSMAHWAPDSKYVFVNERKDQGNRGCVDNSRFVVCRVSDGVCKAVYDHCGLRDWYFGWITNAPRWVDAARSAELELKR